MSKEVVFVLEPDNGRITVEISQVTRQTVDELTEDFGNRVNLNCAKPAERERYLPLLQPQPQSPNETDGDFFSIWLYRLYHNSVVDGPGRRSVAQLSGCSIRCRNCLVPQTWARQNGQRVSISSVVEELLGHREDHDGVTILGGEPFDQPESVAELVSRLKDHGIHIVIYSGYTMEQLIERKHPAINYTLTHIDVLIDGPFISEMRDGAGEYRGSKNQRFIMPSPKESDAISNIS